MHGGMGWKHLGRPWGSLPYHQPSQLLLLLPNSHTSCVRRLPQIFPRPPAPSPPPSPCTRTEITVPALAALRGPLSCALWRSVQGERGDCKSVMNSFCGARQTGPRWDHWGELLNAQSLGPTKVGSYTALTFLCYAILMFSQCHRSMWDFMRLDVNRPT